MGEGAGGTGGSTERQLTVIMIIWTLVDTFSPFTVDCDGLAIAHDYTACL